MVTPVLEVSHSVCGCVTVAGMHGLLPTACPAAPPGAIKGGPARICCMHAAPDIVEGIP